MCGFCIWVFEFALISKFRLLHYRSHLAKCPRSARTGSSLRLFTGASIFDQSLGCCAVARTSQGVLALLARVRAFGSSQVLRSSIKASAAALSLAPSMGFYNRRLMCLKLLIIVSQRVFFLGLGRFLGF